MSSRPTERPNPIPDSALPEGNLPPTEAPAASDSFRTRAVSGPAAPVAVPGEPSIPGYEILGVLGRGGMGVVYRARQSGLQRVVALKMILAGNHAAESTRARFRGEALAVARLQHPNVVQIYEVGEHEGLPYFSLEFVDGGSLDRKLKGAPQPPREAGALVEVLAGAVEAAHRQGIIHRDLKPANVLLTKEGQPKITDFGLAKQLDSGHAQTHTGDIMGTPSYMAPEQAQGRIKEIGPATDVYALGAILYETLTGRPPFRSATPVDTLLQVMSEEPVPPTRLNRQVPRDLETICLKCLAKDPRRRYASAAALADDLRRFREGEAIQARPSSRGERLLRWARRHPALASVLAVTAVAAVALFGVNLEYSARVGKQRDIADAQRRLAEVRGEDAARQAKEAKEAQDYAVKQQRLAEDRAEQLRRHLYAASIQNVSLALAQGNGARALQLLEDQRPLPGQSELRGFEWHYLWRQMHQDRRTLAAPDGHVSALCRDPAGALLAVSRTGQLRRWDAATWNETTITLDQLSSPLRAAAFSPDGRYVALGYRDNQIKLWETKSGKLVSEWRSRHPVVWSLAFSPDGDTLASAGDSCEIRLRDLKTGKDRAVLRGHRAEIFSVAFSPDGTLLASGAGDGVRLWNAATGMELMVLTTKDYYYRMAFSPDGQMLAGGANGRANVWDVATGKLTAEIPTIGSSVFGLEFAPDGNMLVLGLNGNRIHEIQLWSADGKELHTRLRGHTKGINVLAYAPDGETLVSAAADGTVRVWDMGPKACPNPYRPFETAPFVNSLAVDPHAQTLAVAASNRVYLWDVPSQRLRATLTTFTNMVMAVALSPDGQLLATGEGAWPASLMKDDPKDLTGDIQLWDAATGRLRKTLKGHSHGIFSLAFAPDGTLASGSWDRTVRLWDPATGQQKAIFEEPGAMVRSVAFSHDGRRLAASCSDRWRNSEGGVHLWDVATREHVGLFGQGQPSPAIAFAPADDTLAVAVNGGVALWDVRSRKLRLSLEAMDGGGTLSAAFSPDGRTLVSGDFTGSVHVWNLATGQEILDLGSSTPRVNVQALVFSPDGRWLAAGRSDGVRIWDAAPVNDKK